MRKETRVVDLLYSLAETWLALPDEAMATMALFTLLHIEPFHEKGLAMHLKLLDQLRQQHLYEGTLALYRKKKERPGFLDQYLGDLSLRRGKEADAEFFYKSWSDAQPDNPEAIWALCKVMIRQYKYIEAKPVLMRATGIEGINPRVYVDLARVAEQSRNQNDMAAWLSEYRKRVEDAAFEQVLNERPFRKYPRLLNLIE